MASFPLIKSIALERYVSCASSETASVWSEKAVMDEVRTEMSDCWPSLNWSCVLLLWRYCGQKTGEVGPLGSRKLVK